MKVRSTLFALAAVAAAALMTGIATGPAMAQSPAVAVSYGDLNLASLAGRMRLDRRIALAATQVCGRYDARELLMSSLSRACRDGAIAGARASFANPSVSQAAF